MEFQIKDFDGNLITLYPEMKLNYVQNIFIGNIPELTIVLNKKNADTEELEEYAVLTASFRDFIETKNAAYIDVSKCDFVDQLLDGKIIKDTGQTRRSGHWKYPLWVFDKNFLREIGGETYLEYSKAYDKCFFNIKKPFLNDLKEDDVQNEYGHKF